MSILPDYLLAADSRKPSPRVYWCLPILVLWANLHGTASLGAMLVALRGVTLVWERREVLTRSRHAKVADFGLARAVDQKSMTTDGRLIGTALYVSPEQCKGGKATGAGRR